MTGCVTAKRDSISDHGEPCAHEDLESSTERTTYLVRVAHEDILALGLLEREVGDRADDTPSVGKVDVHLAGKVARFVPLRAEDRMPRGVARVGARDVTVSGGVKGRWSARSVHAEFSAERFAPERT